MNVPDIDTQLLRSTAFGWVRRLSSGEATAADAEALERWRGNSPAHAAAFAEAALLWNVLGDAARKADDDRGAAGAQSQHRSDPSPGRRGFLAGGAALAASVAGALVWRPPLDLWPSAAELAADYRTSTGERRTLAIENDIAVELNTRTSVDLRQPANGGARIELVAGEAAISTRPGRDRQLLVIAGDGRVVSRQASFNIRKDVSAVNVSCTAGTVEVSCRDRTVSIGPGQQVAYDARGTSEVAAVDADVITAWQRGLLIFRRAPLSHVIDEVNRYRAGRVILVDSALGRRLVVATFRLDRIDDVIDFMAKAMDVRVRPLTAGVVLVG